MSHHAPARIHRWQAGFILTLFVFAVAGAAAVGWWYARESPPHQGPILLITVDGVPPAAVSPVGDASADMTGIAALAADSVVFDRAYTHSPHILPAHSSILSGQLPVDHGVRDDAGFTLGGDVRTLAELMRNRGFETGAAVSSFLLRRDTGVAQGFDFFDGDVATDGNSEVVARSGTATVDAAERWARGQDDQRYFLFVQVPETDADSAVTRLSQFLKDEDLYAGATIAVVGHRGTAQAERTLDDSLLHVPLMIKQPDGAGAGRRVDAPVQQVDLLPTFLDLVRAPIPGGLRGRSLRAVLDDEEAPLPATPIYSESLAAYFRFGGHPAYAITSDGSRYIRGASEQVIELEAGGDLQPAVSADAGPLREALERILKDRAIAPPSAVAPADLDRLALAGYLPALRAPAVEPSVADEPEDAIVRAHYAAATLVGQRKFSGAVRALQTIVREHPMLAPVHYQIGRLLARTGRLTEATAAFKQAAELRPDSGEILIALADALMRDGRTAEAEEQAAAAIALAETIDGGIL